MRQRQIHTHTKQIFGSNKTKQKESINFINENTPSMAHSYNFVRILFLTVNYSSSGRRNEWKSRSSQHDYLITDGDNFLHCVSVKWKDSNDFSYKMGNGNLIRGLKN